MFSHTSFCRWQGFTAGKVSEKQLKIAKVGLPCRRNQDWSIKSWMKRRIGISLCVRSPDLVAAVVRQHPLISLNLFAFLGKANTATHEACCFFHFSTSLLFQDMIITNLGHHLRLSQASEHSSLFKMQVTDSWSHPHSCTTIPKTSTTMPDYGKQSCNRCNSINSTSDQSL